MTPEAVAAYAMELFFNSPTGSLEESLGETMAEAYYQVSSTWRVSHVIGRLNGRRGASPELDQLIDTVIAHIQGESSIIPPMQVYTVEVMCGGRVLETFVIERSKPPVQFAGGKVRMWQRKLRENPSLMAQYGVKHVGDLTYRFEVGVHP